MEYLYILLIFIEIPPLKFHWLPAPKWGGWGFIVMRSRRIRRWTWTPSSNTTCERQRCRSRRTEGGGAKDGHVFERLHPWRLTWNIIMEVWKIIFLSKWMICRFHVHLPGCTWNRHVWIVIHEYSWGIFWVIGRRFQTCVFLLVLKDETQTWVNSKSSNTCISWLGISTNLIMRKR